LLLFEVYTEKQDFNVLAKKAESCIELFPLQPQFYYFAGLANNQEKNYKKAVTILETGLDYLVDDKSLEINFFIQLGEAYSGLQNTEKKNFYFSKAENALKQIKNKIYNEKLIGCIALFLIFACKSKAVFVAENTNKPLNSDKIIENYYNNKVNFNTLYIKSNAHYEDEKQTQNVSAEIKIKKEEMILISVRFLGITMAKALITPTEVKYYEKVGGKYFEGDFSALSKWLATDLDYQKIQNIFIGQALDNLKTKNYNSTLENNLYKLENNLEPNVKKHITLSLTVS